MQYITDQIIAWLAWVFDPVRLVNATSEVFSWLIAALAYFLPGEVGTAFNNLAANLSSLRIGNLILIALYVFSPLIAPSILKACIGVRMVAWLATLVIRLVMLVKGHFWSSSH